jgi:MOSC domain-containing protein YiiM
MSMSAIILSLESLENGLPEIRKSPLNHGTLQLIVRRPEVDQREELSTAELNTTEGLVGDNWKAKPSSSMPNGEPHPAKQITLMNSRAIAVIAVEKERWKLAGDQLYVDMNLGYDNLPPGSRLSIGNVILQVSEPPHRGCKKFAERFGQDAMRFVNSDAGRELNLRGINAVVIQGGSISVGDTLSKVASA